MEEVGTAGATIPRKHVNHAFRVRVGALLGRGFSIWLKNLLPATLLALLVSGPLVLLGYLFLPRPGDLEVDTASFYESFNSLVAGFTGLLLSGSLSYTTFQQLRGRSVAFGQSLAIGLSRIFPVLGVGILVGLCVILGFVACVIPGIILTCALYVAVPICVVEKPGVVDSLKRSFELTKNNRWQIFGAYLVQGVIAYLLGLAIGAALVVMQASPTTSTVIVTLASAIFGTPNAVMQAVTYHDLRTGKEGAEIEELVAVFE
jgi:hypothetical protein